LNITPKAVNNDLVDQVRKGKRREERIKLHLSLPEEDPDRIEAEEKGAKLKDLLARLEYEWAAEKEIDEWAAGNKKKKRFVQRRIEGYTLKEISEELAIHPNTATNWKKELSEIILPH